MHTEIFFDPQTHTDRGIEFDIVINGIHQALLREKKKIGIILAGVFNSGILIKGVKDAADELRVVGKEIDVVIQPKPDWEIVESIFCKTQQE